MRDWVGGIFGFIALGTLAVLIWLRYEPAPDIPEDIVVEEEAPAEEEVVAIAEPAVPAPEPIPEPEPAPAPEPEPAPRPRDVGPGLGVVATPEQVARVNISISPDGRNLPLGQGTVAEGAIVFAANCVACHGEAGAGGEGLVQLTGGIGTLTSTRPVKTVASFWPHASTVFDYIRRAMPLNAPQTLTDEEVYAVTAYLLSIDEIVPADATLDATTLPLIEMPNRDGFVSWWPPPQVAAAP